MEPRRGAGAAPYADYGLREQSHFRWQLIEPLPTDERALEAELQRLDAKLAGLDNGAEPDYAKGCAVLDARKRAFECEARARFERLDQSVTVLYEHECDQARARYAARCEQLKRDMSGAIQREIRRLQRARDGVAVMDRRRLTRHSGNGSAGAGNGMSGDRDAGNDAAGSADGAPVTEKKRMEVLLSATPIFRRLDKTLQSEDVDADLATIKEVMPSFLRGDAETHEEDVETDEDEQRELEELRKANQGSVSKRRRLVYNAGRLPEGQDVVVYRKTSTPAKKSPAGGRGRGRQSRDDESQQSPVATGTVTAATSTQVFLLAKDGSFQTFPVDDWKAGRVTVHRVEPTTAE